MVEHWILVAIITIFLCLSYANIYDLRDNNSRVAQAVAQDVAQAAVWVIVPVEQLYKQSSSTSSSTSRIAQIK